MKHKSFSVPVLNLKSKGSDRIVTGVAAVFGNVDAGGDVVERGAFGAAVSAFKAGRSRARFLWNHDAQQPPIAKILDVKEVSRDQLPAAVLAKAPHATGGLVVKRQYFKDAFSDRVYQGILNDSISEMSFAYDIKKSRFEDMKDGSKVRILEELDLFDLSDVNWGMNSATVAAGAKRYRGQRRPGSTLSPSIQARINRLKRFCSTLPPTELDNLKYRGVKLGFDIAKMKAKKILAL